MTQLRKFFEYGFALHQQGKLEDAQVIYEQVIRIDNKNFDAIQLLGVIAAQTGDHDRAASVNTRPRAPL